MRKELVFHDDFKNRDLSKWTIETGGYGFGNNESQYYTSGKNVVFHDDGMSIVAKKEKFESNNYTSTKLTTYDKCSIKYGRVDVMARVPKGNGTWPAIWMLPNSFKDDMSWPLCGEIDIMEHIGRNQNTIHVSLHTKTYNFHDNSQYTKTIIIDDATTNYHLYSVELLEGSITFLIDDEVLARFERGSKGDDTFAGWPFDQEFYLIINLAVGGHWGGHIDELSMPWFFDVKDVKIYNYKK